VSGIPPLRPGRSILGMAAVLLPFTEAGAVDWSGFEALVERTLDAGLVPAVNLDTGYVQLLDEGTRGEVLAVATSVAGAREVVAGAYVEDAAGATFDLDAHRRALVQVRQAGATPVVFPSNGLNGLDDDAWVDAHRRFGDELDRFIAFELGELFVPHGRIFGLDAYEALLDVDACIGAKHSSLSRQLEWDRLAVRDRVRPDFHVFTGNDLAIDMVCYGSDYLLGLAAFAPDLFAERDRRWQAGEASFHDLNDALQLLGGFAFRQPVPAYRHDAALFLRLRDWIASDTVPTGGLRRPDADLEVLRTIAARLGVW
jgi:dihydrodipicolinate synthase/N-acetylneuraminate lyase